MGIEFGTGVGEGADAEVAGRAAAEQAREEMASGSIGLAVVYPSPEYDTEAVIDGVGSVVGDAELVGATTVGKFTERGVHSGAFSPDPTVTVALVGGDDVRFFTGIGHGLTADPEGAVGEATADLPEAVEGFPHLTGLFLSGNPLGREETAQLTYQAFPIPWGGGGANNPTLENVTVFRGEDVATDGLVLTLIASTRPVALGVGNRHEPIGEGVEVTAAEGSLVHELDGRPAFEVWKECFAATARERYGFDIEGVEDSRPMLVRALSEMVFGLRTSGDRYKVRSAIATAFCDPYVEMGTDADTTGEGLPVPDFPTFKSIPPGSMEFDEPITEGMVLYPMTSGREGTVERGTRSVQQALADLGDDRVAGGLVFECPCGEATLQEDYHRLVEAVADPLDAPIAGIQSGGGEVCFRPGDMRGVNHTSTTVMLFPGGDGA